MTLIKSISGIRGTIGGAVGDGLTPLDVVKFTAAYGTWIKRNTQCKNNTVIWQKIRPCTPAILSKTQPIFWNRL